MKRHKKIIGITGFYILSFIVAVFLFGYILNYSSTHPARGQGSTSLAKLSVKSSGMELNKMYGFAQEMSQEYLRTCITPVSDNQTIVLKVEEGDSAVDSIRYILYDDTGENELENGECEAIQWVEGEKQTQLRLNTGLDRREEYCLKLIVRDENGEEYNYYTRVISGSDVLAYDKLQFALDFHSATFQKESAERLADYLGVYDSTYGRDFRHVNLHSGSDLITWGELAPVIEGDVDITIKGLDRQSAQIQLIYTVSATDDEGKSYEYMVTELYDVVQSGSDIRLSDYSRTMEEKLDRTSFIFSDDQLRVGMIDEDSLDLHIFGIQEPEVTETEAAAEGETTAEDTIEYNTYISFVGDGRLWVYNTKDNILNQAFSFEGDTPSDTRDASYLNHGIRVIRTEDNGDMFFIVYGYIYNGTGEGHFGIQVNEYSMQDNTSSELLFIPYDKSFQMLRQDIETMAFMDGNGQLYLCLEDTLYCFDVYMKTYETAFEQVLESGCDISGSGQSFVYADNPDGDGKAENLIWMDLETGESKTISSEGRLEKQIGFLESDYVYGVYSSDGSRMESLRVVDEDLNIVREYTVDNGYITDAQIQDTVLTIHRADNSGQTMADDFILKYDSSGQVINAQTISAGERMQETAIATNEYGYDTPIVQTARVVVAYRDTTMDFSLGDQEFAGFYVYNQDRLQKFNTFAQAYTAALANGGKVEDSSGKTICHPNTVNETDLDGYEIAQSDTQEGQMQAVIQWLMTYESQEGTPAIDTTDMAEAMSANLPNVHVVDMTGIGLDDALAMVTEGYPLVVKNSEGRWCVVEGYTNGYIIIADPGDGTVSGYEEAYAIAGIASSGNVIYSYYR